MTPDERISVGILYSAGAYLRLLGAQRHSVEEYHKSFRRLGVAEGRAVFQFLVTCGLIRLHETGLFEASERGAQIGSSSSQAESLRVMLRAWVEAIRPSWLPFLPRGRRELMRYLPKDTRQVLEEASLLHGTEDTIIAWWDDLALGQRAVDAMDRLDTGRFGERLSIRYEASRTGQTPVWKSIESNLAGYDLLSVIALDNPSPLRIEVKTSDSDARDARFFISRGEWNEATVGGSYIFHFWALRPEPMLCSMSVESLQKHVPFDRGGGRWVDFELLYARAREDFAFRKVGIDD